MKKAAHTKLVVRGHHLLCMFGFRGLGYSEAFVENMRRVVEAFFSERGVQVQVVAACDDICAACPHMQGGRCAAEEGGERRARSRDRKVLGMLGLAAGSRSDSLELAQAVMERIDEARLDELCGGCRWLSAGYCREGLRRRRHEA